ncbi:hypothetical protein PG990_012805 [Apiospora arundinis]
MPITPSPSKRREIDGAAKYFRRLERRQGLMEADKTERHYASWDGWSGWRPKGYTYDRPPLPPADPNDPNDSDSEAEDVFVAGQTGKKRARQQHDTDIVHESSGGTKYVRRVKKHKVYHAQMAKPLTRRPPYPLSPSDTSSAEGGTSSSNNGGKSSSRKRMRNPGRQEDNNNEKMRAYSEPSSSIQLPSPPHSRDGGNRSQSPSSSSSSDGGVGDSRLTLSNITPASLRCYVEDPSSDCLLGEDTYKIIIGECKAAESQ